MIDCNVLSPAVNSLDLSLAASKPSNHENVAVRFLTSDTHPDHGSIYKFRRESMGSE